MKTFKTIKALADLSKDSNYTLLNGLLYEEVIYINTFAISFYS